MRRYGIRRGMRRGFTLTEMLVVIVILAVVAAFAIPSLVIYQRELKLTELDDGARSIYMAAQNQLTALRLASSGKQVAQVLSSHTTTYATAVPLAETPSAVNTTVYYVQNEDGSAIMDILVPQKSIEVKLQSGKYLVEYDPASGIVYGVFYTEKDSIPYGSSVSEEVNLQPLDHRGRSFRKRSMVGYYGVGTDSPDLAGPDVQQLPKATVKVINAEALVLDIGLDANGGTVDTGKIGLRVTVGGSEVYEQDPLSFDGTKQTQGLVVLDALKTFGTTVPGVSGGIWTEKTAEPSWSDAKNGEIEVVVTAYYKGGDGGIAALPQTVTVKTNALFAGVTEDGETAQIAYGRHLQNLNKLSEDSSITGAVQIQDIDFLDSTAKTGVYSWAKTYEITEKDGIPYPRDFVPINVNNGDAFQRYNGQNCKISSLYIKEAVNVAGKGLFAGLFGNVDGLDLENIVLVDPWIETDAMYAGGLAGGMSTGSIKSCQVYASSKDAHSKISRSTDTAAVFVGGLAGSLVNSTVTESSASLLYVGSEGTAGGKGTTGGLAGTGNSVTLTKCYAAVGVRIPDQPNWVSGTGLHGATVGGLLGQVTGATTLSGCYSTGVIASAPAPGAATPSVGGLVGGGSDITYSDAYAAMDYSDSVASAAGVTFYGAGPGSETADVKYLTRSKVNQTGAGSPISYGELKDMENDSKWEKASIGNTYPFAMPPGSKYPFLKLAGMTHRGDWPDEDTLPVTFAYFEYYQGGKVGFYTPNAEEPSPVNAMGTEEELRLNTLDNTDPIIEDGYCILFPLRKMGDKMSYSGVFSENLANRLLVTYNTKTDDGADGTDGSFVTLENVESLVIDLIIQNETEKYLMVPLSGEILEYKNGIGDMEHYYQHLSLTFKNSSEAGKHSGRTLLDLWFNPYVAKSAFIDAETSPGAPDTPETSTYRTARQITEHANAVMQAKAVGVKGAEESKNQPHKLLLERDINLNTDPANNTSGEKMDLSIPDGACTVLELNDKTLTGTGAGSVVRAGNARLEIYGGRQGQDTDDTGSGAIKGGGTKVMEEATPTHGGGIYMGGGELLMSGGAVEENTATQGGGIYLSKGVKATLDNVKLLNNTAVDPNGVAVSAENWKNVKLVKCVMTGNKKSGG